MVQNTLNLANIVASVAVAAGNTAAAGPAPLISAALSANALYKSLSPEEQTWAQEIARDLDDYLRRSHLSHDRRKILVQLVEAYRPSDREIIANGEDPAKIASAKAAEIRERANDPAWRSDQALRDYETAMLVLLDAALTPEDRREAREQEILRSVHWLKEQAETSGRSNRLRDEGITENAIIRLAQRIARDTDDLGQAWLELQNAMDIAVQVQREGRTPSNHGDFVDEVLARVAELSAEGDYAGAGDAIAEALVEEDAAHRARKSRLLESGAEVAMLQGDAEAAADYLIRKADLDAGGRAGFAALLALKESYHETGRDRGTALDLEIAVALARVTHDRAGTSDERGAALNDLAVSVQNLGARESGPARLYEAVAAYRAALEEFTRDRVPLYWAMTQQNLGNALKTLGARESGTARVEEAVAALRAALEERTRDRVPLDWARTQQNLGNALLALGERESGTARLEAAVAAYRAALEERTRDRVSLDWARTQMNLGNALQTIGARESGTARLERAVAAYRAALEEWTHDRVPLDWAMAQQNLGTALQTIGGRESGTARLVDAVAAYRAALEELTRDRVPLAWATAQMNLGTALQALGERESGTARLEEAVAAYRAGLEERTRDHVPLGWAMAQMNLANALATLGARECGTARLDEAVAAYRAALEEWTRGRVPLQWAMVQANLAHLEGAFFDKTGDRAHLDRAEGYAQAAREVFVAAQASQYVGVIHETLAEIAARRGG